MPGNDDAAGMCVYFHPRNLYVGHGTACHNKSNNMMQDEHGLITIATIRSMPNHSQPFHYSTVNHTNYPPFTHHAPEYMVGNAHHTRLPG